ncbi:MAG: TrkH family potassium uptake protein [Lactococcus raffinolactis]|uniref:TrkH family potassium uptake protein n=1 Tax=Pseudolactococcus raffinolactis TaxID=1366 RepID=UPI003994DF58
MNNYMRTLRKLSASQIIVLSFMVVVLLGFIMLSLPISNRNHDISLIDTLFVTVSALCVTGLSPNLINEQYSIWGQAVILLLIEVGGLGIMSISIIFYYIGRRKIDFKKRIILKESLNLEVNSGEVTLTFKIIKMSILIQSLGMIALSFFFVPKFGFLKGIWFSIFHAISAFCNAGFDLFGNSLVDFKDTPGVLFIISLLIIFGGLGFVILIELFHNNKQRLSLHSKIALITTSLLLIIGFLYFLFDKSVTGSVVDKLSQSLFLASTPRTAGFYSIDYSYMNDTGIIITMLFMFIGGTSGSTAGGVKTTTIAVLFLKIKSLLKRKSKTEVFERTISDDYILKAFIIFLLTICAIIGSLILLSITESNQGVSILELMFEIVSAIGTVGLTLGITEKLSIIGKIIIIILMIVGRIGIFTFVLSTIRKNRDNSYIKYPNEIVMLG